MGQRKLPESLDQVCLLLLCYLWHPARCLIHSVCVCVCVHAKSVQSCLTLCDPVDWSPPGSSVHGILQARMWSGLACPSPGDLPDPGIEPEVLRSPVLAGGFFTTSATWKAQCICFSSVQFSSVQSLSRVRLFATP